MEIKTEMDFWNDYAIGNTISTSEDVKWVRVEDIEELLEIIRKRNPYPQDVFQSVQGRFGFQVWNNCIDDIYNELSQSSPDYSPKQKQDILATREVNPNSVASETKSGRDISQSRVFMC